MQEWTLYDMTWRRLLLSLPLLLVLGEAEAVGVGVGTMAVFFASLCLRLAPHQPAMAYWTYSTAVSSN